MKKKMILILSIVLIIWMSVGITDYARVHSFEKPIFSIPTVTADDGGSGRYIGIGYSFKITGNFMPEDEFPGVTKYKYYLFGIDVKSGSRE